jgi:hypothetical protein
VAFSGSSLGKVDFFPFARKVLSHIHDYLGKHISITFLLLHKKDDEEKLLINSYAQKRKKRIFLHKKTFWSG